MWFHFFTERDCYLFFIFSHVYCTETSERRLMIWMCVILYRTQALECNVCVCEWERESERPGEDQRRNLADSSGLNDQRNKHCSRWRGESLGWYSSIWERYGRRKHASDIKRASVIVSFKLSTNVDLPNDSVCLSILWFAQKTISFFPLFL